MDKAPTPGDVQRRMAKGAIWMVLFKLVERSLGLVSTLILARLLVPADFGVVAMALSFIAMAELLTTFGFDVALIQNQKATAAHFNTAWTGNLLLGLFITLLMLAMAAPIADFYQKPEVYLVVIALAFGPMLSGLENIGVVAFRKELNFRREFLFQLARKCTSFVVVIPLAFAFRNYWALVAGILVSRAGGTAVSYLMHPFRPRLSLKHFSELFGFSRWLLANNMVGFFKERTSDFVIGRLFGAAPLGTYNISYELANLPSTELSAPINRALLPGFARMSSAQEVTAAYGNALGVLALLTIPAAAGLFAVAPQLVAVVLGAKWLGAIPLMEVLAFNGALLMFHSSICAVLIARGYPAHVTLTNGVYVGILLALLAVLATQYGVVGAAYAALLSSVLTTPLYLYQMRRRLGVSPALFVRAITRPLVASVVMAVSVRAALPAFSPDAPAGGLIGWLLAGIGLGVISYVAAVIALWRLAGAPPGAERLVSERARAIMLARFSSPTGGVRG